MAATLRQSCLQQLLILQSQYANLTMGLHSKALSKSCFYHIRSFRQIRSFMDDVMAASVALALVSSRLDQKNSVLYGIALKHTACLQRVQHALARVMVNRCSRPPFSSNALLEQLTAFRLTIAYSLNSPP